MYTVKKSMKETIFRPLVPIILASIHAICVCVCFNVSLVGPPPSGQSSVGVNVRGAYRITALVIYKHGPMLNTHNALFYQHNNNITIYHH